MYARKLLTVAVLAAINPMAFAAEQLPLLEEMVVTGVRTDTPLHVSTDPKAPRQPLPAHDGADYLKTIPGFSVVRKGGTDGDPVLRGMAGSRLSMLVDGELILGGCNNRMDPPTAYIFPETFDSIKVIKGPQSVQHGPGNSAGVVLFERNGSRPEQSEWKVHTSALAASFGRRDEVVDATYSSPTFSIRGSATNARADDYEDGDGVSIHSQYQRWNAQLTLAWTPDDHTRYEFSTAASDGEAAYADRGVDGSKFARENYSFKFEREHLSPLIEKLETQVYYNYVDHVMDNYSLREPAGMTSTRVAMNPDRETTGGKFALTLKPTAATDLVIGVDGQKNIHTSRNTMNQTMMPLTSLARQDDASFTQVGLFAELGWDVSDAHRLITGVRVDDWSVQDERSVIPLNMMMSLPNPNTGMEMEDTLKSGFIRYEGSLAGDTTTFYAGVGHNERFPDYWEIIAKESATSVSAMGIRPEKNTQLDTGFIYRKGPLSGSISAFYNEIDDYLMIQSGYMKPAGMTGTRMATIVRNIDARSWGLELDGQYRFNESWRSELTLSSVRGANDSDGTTLAQLPPLEMRLGLYFDREEWSAGLLWRALASQDRVDPGKGNIVGQDFGPTDSANILSINAGWRPSEQWLVTAGVDNLLDKTYAEHISRSGASIPGFDQIRRVNEPGRTAWVKAQLTF